MSTSTLGGHVNTIPEQVTDGRRRRRSHSDEFKADAVAACTQRGVSIAAVAMSMGINANLLRRWVNGAEMAPASPVPRSPTPTAAQAPKPAFMPVALPEPAAAASDIRVELRRGPTTVVVTWPAGAAGECAAWMRELLR